MYEKNSIIQRKLRIINLLLAEVVVRKLHVTDGLSNCCLLLNSFTIPVFSNFLLNFFSAFSMFSPSFTGTTIILLLLICYWLKNSAVKLRRKITHTFFIHKTFGKYFSKTIHKQVIKCGKLVPLKHLHVYNNIIRYETEYKRASTRATDDISS